MRISSADTIDVDTILPNTPVETIILATHNPGKVREIRAILEALPLVIVSLIDRPEIPETLEDGATLEENAQKKAADVFTCTRIPALADDSGLEVYALGMQPGVISARFAGDRATYDDNNEKLLRLMRGFQVEDRKARFRCVAAFVTEGGFRLVEGVCEGSIATEPKGTSGFGYDPVFIPEGYAVTFAEMDERTKSGISHRGKAFRGMSKILSEYLLNSRRAI